MMRMSGFAEVMLCNSDEGVMGTERLDGNVSSSHNGKLLPSRPGLGNEASATSLHQITYNYNNFFKLVIGIERARASSRRNQSDGTEETKYEKITESDV